MPSILVRHRVEDYERWRSHLDGSRSRAFPGAPTGGQVFRTTGDPNEVWVLMTWDTEESKRIFFEATAEHEDLMRAAGVIGAPEAFDLDELPPVDIQSWSERRAAAA
jgi:hypothetical protein